MTERLKHLEFLQIIITRMNSNSFSIKGWTITLIAGVLAVAASLNNPTVTHINYLVILGFWLLDSFYLSQERQYRELYNEIAKKEVSEKVSFNLSAKKYDNENRTWIKSFISKTLIIFYPFLIGVNFLISCLSV